MIVITAAVLAALAGWWAAGPPRAPAPLSVPVAGPGASGVLGLRTRVGAGAALGVLAAQLAPGPWWVRLVAAVVVGAVGFWGLGLIGPDHRDDEALRGEFAPEALTLLACGVEAGLPLGAALAAVAPTMPGIVGADLARVQAGHEIGLAERDAWAALEASEAWRRAATDIGRVATSGAAVAPVLRRHAELLVHADRDARLETARTTGVRSVFPLMVCFLPSFVLVGIVPAIGGVVMTVFR
ncbi:type II secretion system F family protein [Mariniluteicoccus flavus]